MKKLRKIVWCLVAATLLIGCSKEKGTVTAEETYKDMQEVVEETSKTEEIEEIPEFWIKYLDVGQADAALICSEGEYMLIDGGNPEDSSKIYSILEQEQVENLALVVASHAHKDHVGGLAGAYNYAASDVTLCPVTDYDSDAFRDFSKYVTVTGGEILVPQVGDTYEIGGAELKILGLNVNAGESENNSSIICKVIYGDTSFLFTGDAEYEAEISAVESGVDLSADVLKVSHHGSDTGSSYRFIGEVMPKVAVISVGEENEYGHPTDRVLSRLSDAEITVYRTDLQGDITIKSDGKDITVITERSASGEEIMKQGRDSYESDQLKTETNSELEEITYICNENSKKFHAPSCESVSKMKEKNKVYYKGSREELILLEYEPCGGCKP